MGVQVHVNGEAFVSYSTISTGISTSTGNLINLGVSLDGVDIEIRDITEPVIADTTGPTLPFDEQQFLMDALIRMQLVVFDEGNLAVLRGRHGTGTEGIIGNAGALWAADGTGTAAGYFRLLVASPTDTTPWNFPKTRLRNSFSVKIGTRRSLWNLEFYAQPAVNSATRATALAATTGATSSRILYNRIAT